MSRKLAELARQELEALRDEDKLTPDLVFRDPYFLGLADMYSEKDVESAILRELQQFTRTCFGIQPATILPTGVTTPGWCRIIWDTRTLPTL